ncbi:MAG: carboxylating nicotinate-nucleotide diphosphorylase [Oscillospiraceae bacterium]
MLLPEFYVDDVIKRALEEDINYIDLATDLLISDEDTSAAEFVSKADGVLAGIDCALRTFTFVDSSVKCEIFIHDGEKVKKGDVIARVEGKTRSILKAERTSLNILQHMSGVATATNRLVEACSGTKASIVDTRKTLPGLRALEKYAVTAGGGRNHRFNLSDAAMLKDNHIDAYGSITGAVSALKAKIGHMAKIEVEVRNKEELLEALNCKCDVIMLDNMTPEEMTECVKITDGRAVLEASGNVTIDNVAAVAASGVDIISVGAITHSVKVFDISLKIRK